MFCGFLVFWCKRVLEVEEVVNARYGVIEQWALLLRNAWPKVQFAYTIGREEKNCQKISILAFYQLKCRILIKRRGVTPPVYSCKEPVHLTERERQKLQVWSRIMPYRESFAWAIVPLFDNSIGGASGGSASPSSRLAPSMSGSSSHEGVLESVAKITLDGKMGYSSRSSIVVEISNLHKVKESYTEESLQDPKYKVHRPVKGVLRLEIEKHQTSNAELETISESASMTNESMCLGDQVTDAMFIKSPNNGPDGPQSSNSKWIPMMRKMHLEMETPMEIRISMLVISRHLTFRQL
ncbi:hypothetical protein SLA2020_320800 [Shorea laevis]